MRFPLPGFLRLACVLGLGSTVLAIEVSRWTPEAARRARVQPANLVGINGLAFPGADQNARFLDAESGALAELPLHRGECIDNVAVSPWQDERGASLVVGRWRKGEGEQGYALPTEFGLACFTYPQGEEVERVPSDVLPQGGTCWYPGEAKRVLFAAGDGRLYRLALTGGHASDDDRPQPLRWAVAPPGVGPVMIREPFWPHWLPGFERIVLVSLYHVEKGSSGHDFASAQLWWLRLDASGTSIVAAGRLLGPSGITGDDELAPSVARREGGLALAYVTLAAGTQVRSLHVAPLRLDAKSGVPGADRGRDVVLARDCADAAPAFSADGRRVFALLHPNRPEAQVGRFAVPEDLTAQAKAARVATGG